MKNIDWNKHTLESALAESPRACRVSDQDVACWAPCGRAGFKSIIREYLREYAMNDDDGNDGWMEGSVAIYGRRREILDETRFFFKPDRSFRLTVPFGQLRADGFRY